MLSRNDQAGKSSLRIAVVGGGAAGITASYYLGLRHKVDLFEAAPKLGGHVQTVMAKEGDNRDLPVDMGFIVFNDRTYPHFNRFLQKLGVQSAPTDMSFSYSEPHTGFAYSGTGLSGLFARRTNIIDPAFWRMLFAVTKFCKNITKDLENKSLSDDTLGRYLVKNRYPRVLMSRYLGPMVQAIWSAECGAPEDFPLDRFARFFFNHGLLSIRGGPTWLYIPGGSHSYVHAFERSFTGNIRTSCPVQSISRSASGPELKINDQYLRYDAVVLACHADTALSLLADPDEDEKKCLGPWRYVANDVVMHTDLSFLPANRRAWACWNVIADSEKRGEKVSIHYWMNLLQRFDAASNYVVTLNPRCLVPHDLTHQRLEMSHPQFTVTALKTQAQFDQLQGRRSTYYCGSYHGNGFHEDAAASGVRVAELLGVEK